MISIEALSTFYKTVILYRKPLTPYKDYVKFPFIQFLSFSSLELNVTISQASVV